MEDVTKKKKDVWYEAPPIKPCVTAVAAAAALGCFTQPTCGNAAR
jgi:hypothetical protein